MPAKKPLKKPPKRLAIAGDQGVLIKKNLGGRPEFKPSADHRALVRELSAYGIPQDKIAILVINPETGIGISEVTLRKVFVEEIRTGLAEGQQQVIGSLFKNAVLSNNVAAQIFLAKARYGYRERDDGHAPMVPEKDNDENTRIEKARRVAFMLAQGARAAKALAKS
jgi:hypothetical protein